MLKFSGPKFSCRILRSLLDASFKIGFAGCACMHEQLMANISEYIGRPEIPGTFES